MNKTPQLLVFSSFLCLLFVLSSCSGKNRTLAVQPQQAVNDYCKGPSETCKNSEFTLPVLPLVEQEVSEEVSYIFFSDHMDRMSGAFLKDLNRDRIRLNRVRALYENGDLKDWEDKYKAAFIFIHAGGPFANLDVHNFYIATKLFEEVSREADDPLVAKESAAMAEQALNKYVNASILQAKNSRSDDEMNPLPLLRISLNEG